MLSAPTLTRLASLAAFLNTAPGLRGGQPADERFTAAEVMVAPDTAVMIASRR